MLDIYCAWYDVAMATSTSFARPLWVNSLWMGLATSIPLFALAISFHLQGATAAAVLMAVVWTAFVVYTITVNAVWSIRKKRGHAIRRGTLAP